MSLRSLSLAGNPLNAVELERNLQKSLVEFICQPYLQHFDLSLTRLKLETAVVCM